MSEHRVNPRAFTPYSLGEILSGMHSRVSISMAFARWQVLWPVFIWPLALPACLLFTLITMLVFSLQRWRCPLRMPMTLECADPSQDRMIKKKSFQLLANPVPV